MVTKSGGTAQLLGETSGKKQVGRPKTKRVADEAHATAAPSVKRGRGRPPLPEHLRKAPKPPYVPTGKPRGRPAGGGVEKARIKALRLANLAKARLEKSKSAGTTTTKSPKSAKKLT